MFVQEMHYMTQNIAKALDQENTEIVEDLSERLKIYELRALTLFKDMDLSQIMDDLSGENTQHLSPASSSFDEFWNLNETYFQAFKAKKSKFMKYNMILKNDLKQNKRLIIFSTSLFILTTNHGK